MSLFRVLADGTPVDIEIMKLPPIVVAVTPHAGDTVDVWFNIGSENWYEWDAGPVTVPTIRVVRGQVRQVRFQRTNGASALSEVEIL